MVEKAEYVGAIEQAYVALRGQGYMLSPRDIELVLGWYGRGVPLEVAQRVLEEGVIDYRRTWLVAGAPRSVAYFEGRMRDAMAARAAVAPAPARPAGEDADAAGVSGGGAGGEGDALVALVTAALEAAGRGAASEAVREVLRGAWRRLRLRAAAADAPDAWALTTALDAEIAAELYVAMPVGARERLDGEVAVAVRAAGGGRMSALGQREHEATERDARVRAYHGVPELLEVLLEQAV